MCAQRIQPKVSPYAKSNWPRHGPFHHAACGKLIHYQKQHSAPGISYSGSEANVIPSNPVFKDTYLMNRRSLPAVCRYIFKAIFFRLKCLVLGLSILRYFMVLFPNFRSTSYQKNPKLYSFFPCLQLEKDSCFAGLHSSP